MDFGQMWPQLVTWLLMLITGGAFGAILTRAFQKRASRTNEIPLIERVNRKQAALAGIKFVRTSPSGEVREVTNLRTYQMTLHNTSDKLIRNDAVQFEFSCEDVEPWVSRPAKSKIPLELIDSKATPPWTKSLRWKIPNLPPGDSVEFSFQLFDPQSEEYEALIDSDKNIVLKRTKGEPDTSYIDNKLFGFGLIFTRILSFSTIMMMLVMTFTAIRIVFNKGDFLRAVEFERLKPLICSEIQSTDKREELKKFCGK